MEPSSPRAEKLRVSSLFDVDNGKGDRSNSPRLRDPPSTRIEIVRDPRGGVFQATVEEAGESGRGGGVASLRAPRGSRGGGKKTRSRR